MNLGQGKLVTKYKSNNHRTG